jgi:thiol:disulfide interchange protein
MLAMCVLMSFVAYADPPASPFGLKASMALSNGIAWVTFRFDIPPEHVLYAERLSFQSEDGQTLKLASFPDPVLHHDEVSGEEKKVYDHPFSAVLPINSPMPLNLIVKMQGCSNTACYFPEKHRFTVTAAGIVPESVSKVAAADATSSPNSAINTNGFKVVARETGYIPRKAFLTFLERARTGQTATPDALSRFNQLGPLVSLLLIVVGGLGLNLTPCVLPLIPINLAIIGAGARASSRRRGFALGGTYGAGMALVYGILGLVVVLTGSKFGALNSSAWFNVGIALVFVVMSLAMFDIINVDFSRFQGKGATSGSGQKGPYVLALTMGVMAALLAGACVAPVVISVLLLAAHLYGKGVVLGLLLPFLLGLGMALPWPFAGAGLSFLPKPGMWMKWVKYSFGMLILLFAGYYGHLAIKAFQNDQPLLAQARPSSGTGARVSESDTALAKALEQARAEHLPVFIDFGASWCKNCVAMDSTVFSSDEVTQQLKQFIAVRYDAEKPNDSPAKEVLNQFGVIGLPTYVVLIPEK